MAISRRPLPLAMVVTLYRLFLRAFPKEFRVQFGDDVSRAFEERCRQALETEGILRLMAYAGRGCLDATKEGLAERKSMRKRKNRGGDGGGGYLIDSIGADLRFGFRTLTGRPVFTGVALLILALGIGSATAIFSVLNGVLLKPFPYPASDRLVVLWNTNVERGQEEFRMSAPHVFELQRSTSAFTDLALVAGATANLTADDLPPARVDGALVSAEFFGILGIQPQLGRLFREEENRGDHRVVLLNYALWTQRFGEDPEIVGRTITMDGVAVQVVGVMPPLALPIGGSTLTLPGPDVPLFWRPLNYDLDWVSDIGAYVMATVARLQPGRTVTQAQEEVSAVASSLVLDGLAPEGQGIFLRSFKEQVVGDVRRNLVILLAAVGLLLLLACGNVTNLLLARAKDRERELSVRSAIGAGRGRLLRQAFTETTLLSLGGGILGLAFAHWASAAMVTRLPSNLPRQEEIGVDGTVLSFTVATVLFASILAALIPTVRLAGRDAMTGLRSGGRWGTQGRERNRANRAIVVAQLSIATTLLFGAGLLFRSLRTLEEVDPGFRKEGVLTAQLMLPDNRYGAPGDILSLYDELAKRVRAFPGVLEVAWGMNHPLENTWWNGIGLLDRPPPDPGQRPTAIFRPVSEGYFNLMGIPLREGRAFESGDGFDAHPVMVVNQAFVDRYYQGESPLGDRVEFTVGRFIWGEAAPTVFEVVGVVGDVQFNGLREPSEPAFHIPMYQFPYQAVKIMVRSSGDPEDLAGLVQAEIWAIDPDLPVTEVRTLEQVFADAVAQDRFNVTLLEAFALAALVLAAAGVFGVLNYTVSQRRGELGVRMALGAEASSVLRMVVGEAALLGGIGLTLGLALALALGRFLGSLLFQVPAHDLLVVGGVCLVLGMVALGSGLIPAFRAAGTDPMEALSAE